MENIENGFIFEINNKVYFIKSDNEKKSKKMAREFLEFFNKIYGKANDDKNLEFIFNRLEKVTLRLSNDKRFYFINSKYMGMTEEVENVIIINS